MPPARKQPSSESAEHDASVPATALRLTDDVRPGDVVVRLPRGGLNNSLAELDQQLDIAFCLEPRALVLDLSEIGRMSSTTVAELLWARQRCSRRGVEVHLWNPTRQCREALERIGLVGRLDMRSR
ncbi:hypothetical protein ASC77_25100 [Nocardioides sp. Root1257]|uniref:STAS domain-containing protein n=1 Tax=unclassified Nocardioides TaxID=2615069 RepID=UPI0006F2FA2D|nr:MULTISPECIES: STAS domain-containing protein [unclassified Nocardioides]KQW50939.1 hypothetical protein ASC77_25100 [Nocardioides sp. Root1257]KRC53735.1 hypothetical protein ASE24_24890 [Nocardioides sp. Root224]